MPDLHTIARLLALAAFWFAMASTGHGQIQALPAQGPQGEVLDFTRPAPDQPAPLRQPPTTIEPESVTFGESDEAWTWQMLPTGLMYRPYLAGIKEPRLAIQAFSEKALGGVWDVTLGGRIPFIRLGTNNSAWPEGFELDVEGAAFPRLDLTHERDIWAVDFRAGTMLTYRRGRWETSFGYRHVCSHLVDEYIEDNPSVARKNYVRDVIVSGIGFRPVRAVRLYAEAGWAFNTDGGADPWDFQFGIEFSPVEPTNFWAEPFVALNAHLREEVNYGGAFTAQAGLQWRGIDSHLFRLGVHYMNGKSEQYQFYNNSEQQIGMGLWFDY